MNIELTPELESRLQTEAERHGADVSAYALHLLDSSLPRYLSATELLRLSPEEREPYLRRAAEDAAPLYNADLALPPGERELTAFTALDGEPFCEDDVDADS